MQVLCVVVSAAVSMRQRCARLWGVEAEVAAEFDLGNAKIRE